MSVIAAIMTPGFALMASDSQITPRKGAKPVVKIYRLTDGGLLGCSGYWGMIRNLVREWNNRGSFDAIPKSAWLPGQGIDALYLSPDGKAFLIDGAWSITEMDNRGFYATGSGGDAAAGCLWKSLQGLDLKTLRESKARELLHEAIRCACLIDDGCGGKVRIKKL